MTIQDIINLAAASEVKNIKVREDIEAMLGYINLGMIELYDRFPLKTEEFLFERDLVTSIYTLPADTLRLVSGYGPTVVNNKIELAELPINEENSVYSINQISWSQIQVSNGIAEGEVSLIYIAAPVMYTEADLTSDIALPPQFINALLAFIGYKGNDSVDDGLNKEDSLMYQRFEAACNRLKMTGSYTSDDVSMDRRIETRGFK